MAAGQQGAPSRLRPKGLCLSHHQPRDGKLGLCPASLRPPDPSRPTDLVHVSFCCLLCPPRDSFCAPPSCSPPGYLPRPDVCSFLAFSLRILSPASLWGFSQHLQFTTSNGRQTIAPSPQVDMHHVTSIVPVGPGDRSCASLIAVTTMGSGGHPVGSPRTPPCILPHGCRCRATCQPPTASALPASAPNQPCSRNHPLWLGGLANRVGAEHECTGNWEDERGPSEIAVLNRREGMLSQGRQQAFPSVDWLPPREFVISLPCIDFAFVDQKVTEESGPSKLESRPLLRGLQASLLSFAFSLAPVDKGLRLCGTSASSPWNCSLCPSLLLGSNAVPS